jgi:activator of HSP90 ATPase
LAGATPPRLASLGFAMQAGTFEERNVTEWAKERLKELLVGCDCGPLQQQGASLTITEVTSCGGEAHQWLVRGKKRGGFEFQLSLKWRAELGADCWAVGSAR